MRINDVNFISKCCMSDVEKKEGEIYVCKKCENACDLIEAQGKDEGNDDYGDLYGLY